MKYILSICLLFSLSFVFSQTAYKISNYNFVVKGTSNLHDWQSKVNEVRATATVTVDKGTLKAISSLWLEIPVKTIKSEKGSIMDNKTYDALKADSYPNITFNLEKVTSLNKSGDGYDVNAKGSMTIAGTTKKIDIYVRGKAGSDGTVSFSGSKKIKMTDYGIKPPTALMGTLTTGDEVEIVFSFSMK